VHGSDLVSFLEVAAQDAEQSPEPIRPAWLEFEHQGEFRDFALADADAAVDCGLLRQPGGHFQLWHHLFERGAT
jgi:hypothetical protein